MAIVTTDLTVSAQKQARMAEGKQAVQIVSGANTVRQYRVRH